MFSSRSGLISRAPKNEDVKRLYSFQTGFTKRLVVEVYSEETMEKRILRNVGAWIKPVGRVGMLVEGAGVVWDNVGRGWTFLIASINKQGFTVKANVFPVSWTPFVTALQLIETLEWELWLVGGGGVGLMWPWLTRRMHCSARKTWKASAFQRGLSGGSASAGQLSSLLVSGNHM